jgi:pyruvate,water dikinase
MPADIADAISRAYAELGDADLPVAVRSSATAEDLPDMSFAGQYESYLNQHGEAQVLAAVKHCWASLWTARAIDYRARNGIAPESVSLAVLVQKLILADASGIMFTANPLTGAGENVVINAAWRMGEAVVGGKVTPDSIVINKISGKVIEQRLGQKEVMTVRTPDDTCEAAVPINQRMAAVLSPAQAATLAHLGTQIETLYGQAIDIEWARDHDQFFIVQARPITIKCGHNPALGEWNDSLTGDYLWTNANYGEAAPDVMTPCTWSVARMLLDNADPSVGRCYFRAPPPW